MEDVLPFLLSILAALAIAGYEVLKLHLSRARMEEPEVASLAREGLKALEEGWPAFLTLYQALQVVCFTSALAFWLVSPGLPAENALLPMVMVILPALLSYMISDVALYRLSRWICGLGIERVMIFLLPSGLGFVSGLFCLLRGCQQVSAFCLIPAGAVLGIAYLLLAAKAGFLRPDRVLEGAREMLGYLAKAGPRAGEELKCIVSPEAFETVIALLTRAGATEPASALNREELLGELVALLRVSKESADFLLKKLCKAGLLKEVDGKLYLRSEPAEK